MKGPGRGLMVLGFAMVLAGIVWGAIGYYVSQTFFLLALIGGGIALARVGAKMADDPNPTKPVAWTPSESPSPTSPTVTQDAVDAWLRSSPRSPRSRPLATRSRHEPRRRRPPPHRVTSTSTPEW